jgi:hypothetical protein
VAVVGDSSDCRSGLSDNLRQPPRPWRSDVVPLAHALQKRLEKDVRNLKENDHGRLYLAVGNRLERD